jgi:3-deoxy-D-manno-octulosonate 8-phosphate phosphatase (KDO 8-P phosphatase)
VFDDVLRSKGVDAEHVAYMGDDVVDVPLFRKVGMAIAVADACQEARKAADYVTDREGGHGAVREVCDLILRARGDWKKIIAQYEIS